MNLTEARKAMGEPNETRPFRLVRAAAMICARENAGVISLQELLQCLERGNSSRRLALLAEYAAIALYDRTGREKTTASTGCKGFITDYSDWKAYLKLHRLI